MVGQQIRPSQAGDVADRIPAAGCLQGSPSAHLPCADGHDVRLLQDSSSQQSSRPLQSIPTHSKTERQPLQELQPGQTLSVQQAAQQADMQASKAAKGAHHGIKLQGQAQAGTPIVELDTGSSGGQCGRNAQEISTADEGHHEPEQPTHFVSSQGSKVEERNSGAMVNTMLHQVLPGTLHGSDAQSTTAEQAAQPYAVPGTQHVLGGATDTVAPGASGRPSAQTLNAAIAPQDQGLDLLVLVQVRQEAQAEDTCDTV